MTSLFPDLNVWLALSVAGHLHSAESWIWLESLPRDARLIFSRYTNVGLLRLLTNQSMMGEQLLTLRQAWTVYDKWLGDPRVEFYAEPQGIDLAFRQATEPFLGKPASKLVGDCYLLAFAAQSGSTLVTFDKALLAIARKQGHPAVEPA